MVPAPVGPLFSLGSESDLGGDTSRGQLRDFGRVSRKFIAAPDHMQIRAHEEQTELIDIAGPFTGNFEDFEGSMHFSKRSFEARNIGGCSAQPEERVSRTETVMKSVASLQPNVWEAGAPPGRRDGNH